MSDIVRYQAPAPAIPYAEMEKMAAVIATSGLFGVKNPNQALALMLVAQAEGLHPATAARDYHVIQGRPALKADAMLARFHAAGGKVEWLAYTDTVCRATFSHPAGGKVSVEWTIEMARAAGLTGKDVWKQFPRPMLRSRVVSEGIRTVYPAVLCGMYTPEEVVDMVEVQGPAETTGPAIPAHSAGTSMPEYPSIAEIRKKLAGIETVAGQLDYWQSLKIDNASPRFAEIRAAFTEARRKLENEIARSKPYDMGNAEFILCSMPTHEERSAWLSGEKNRMKWDKDDQLYIALANVVEEMAGEKRVPLNPAPGQKATKESLAAAGYGDGDPAPFDDELEVL